MTDVMAGQPRIHAICLSIASTQGRLQKLLLTLMDGIQLPDPHTKQTAGMQHTYGTLTQLAGKAWLSWPC